MTTGGPPIPPPRHRGHQRRTSFWRSWQGALVGLGALAVIAASFVLPGVLRSQSTSESPGAAATGVAQGAGLPAGSAVPTFAGQDVLSGKEITSSSVYDHKTLLFFSEGVSCQACLEQIQGLQQVEGELTKRGIQLISITPDPPGVLRQAAAAYGITTPVISDAGLSISEAFNTLGQGMHPDTPGHAFALIYHGTVLWYRDYWITDHTMYVQPKTLLADLSGA